MTTKRVFRIDPLRSAGIASLLSIIGSVLWLPAAFMWRSKVMADGDFQAMREQFAGSSAMWMEPPAWLIAISPITNGGLVFVGSLITVWLFNWLLKRLGGLEIQVDEA
ncbi:MAG: hypothetical protein FKY71_17285 [Spiribacter salinus]|uniref:Uncharacterized protein n=1 Tax=Spiribacter salinus TaxID=1335746 RepID=A0A540VEN2_9GAMM|nr:MAG: hypothetical protein FKY71_17285 [Spiribacter salinus]